MNVSPRHGAQERKSVTVSKQDRLSNQRRMRVFGAFVALVAAFALGFLVRSQPAFVGMLGFNVEGEPGASATSSAVKTTYDSVSARVSEVEDILAQSSLDTYELDAATASLVQSFMETTGDPYAAYFTPDRYASYVGESVARSYEGVGVLFSEYNGRAYAADVFEGSEAEAKGVLQGDVVVAIDGDDSVDWTLAEVLNALAAEADGSVVISWMRPSIIDAQTGEEFTTTLEFKAYEEVNLESSLDGEVGYLKLKQITADSAELVRSALVSLSEQGATRFVLDLRGNPGGYLTQAVDIASYFVKSGVIVQVKTVDGVTSKTAAGVTITDAPLVVLVDSYTAAAAEVLAAALQDNQRATVVGETSMGKGTVQLMRELSFGGAIRYTAAFYQTPLGREIDGTGVIPNVKATGEQAQELIAIETVLAMA